MVLQEKKMKTMKSGMRFLLSFLLAVSLCQALVISPPLGPFQTLAPEKEAVYTCEKLKLRSTKENDIGEISHILATSLLGCPEDGQFNFKKQMELLKTKSGVDSLLRSRIQAMESASSVECPLEYTSETDQLRFLWSHSSFVNKLEKSATLSREPHMWHDYNFACAPESSCWLQHKMITAQDSTSGDVVGFCEVAMVSCPSGDEYCPTIMNLATSPRYRRQGIATKILQSAERYVRQEWNSNSLSLYVESGNKAAISLYESMGFVASPKVVKRGGSDQLYLSKQSTPFLATPSLI